MRGLSLLGAVLGLARVASASTVWIDTDVSIGSPFREVDDGYALVLAFHSPELRIAGISTSYGNASLGHTTRAAQELGRQFGGQAHLRAADIFRGATSPRDAGRRSEASEALAAALRKESITYIALGALTNLATFVRLHPKLAGRITRVMFVGGQAEGTNLGLGPSGTFHIHDANVFKDPASAEIVMRSGLAITLVPAGVAANLIMTREDLRELERNSGAGNYLARNSRIWIWFWTTFVRTKGGPVFDAVAVAGAVRPRLLTWDRRYARMDEDRNLIVSQRRTKETWPVQFCTGFSAGTKAFVMSRLGR
jgi:inosine-uridine nucleoside N-ribohydrolase